jgi:hypothetical protein
MKSSITLQKVTVGAIALLLLLPLLSLIIPIPATRLEGIDTGVTAPKWSRKEARKGKYQERWTNWALKNHPLWSWSVKATNEIVFRLTGELSLDYGTSIQGGRDGYLWQPMYLRSFNRALPVDPKEYAARFKKLKIAEKRLAEHGIPLIFVINPNILMLYPEILPEKYQAIRPEKNGYELAQRYIERYKPTVVDAFGYLKDVQPQFPIKFFEPTGSHWNDIGSCLAARKVGETLARAWKEQIPDPQCENYSMVYPPHAHELDLIKIANLLQPNELYRPAPYVSNVPKAGLKKPRRVLLVGTSFLFGLEKQLLKRSVASSTTLLFYNRQLRRDGKGPFRTLDKKKVTKETILSYDAIIVDGNVANPIGMGYGFVDTINQLLAPPKKIEIASKLASPTAARQSGN